MTAWKAYDLVQNHFNVMVLVFDAGARRRATCRASRPTAEALHSTRRSRSWRWPDRRDMELSRCRLCADLQYRRHGRGCGSGAARRRLHRPPPGRDFARRRSLCGGLDAFPRRQSDIHAQVFDANGDKSGLPIVSTRPPPTTSTSRPSRNSPTGGSSSPGETAVTISPMSACRSWSSTARGPEKRCWSTQIRSAVDASRRSLRSPTDASSYPGTTSARPRAVWARRVRTDLRSARRPGDAERNRPR